MTKNHLSSLPRPNNNHDLNRLEQLYLSFNELGNDVLEVVCGYPRLQVLHLAYNGLTEVYERLDAYFPNMTFPNWQNIDK